MSMSQSSPPMYLSGSTHMMTCRCRHGPCGPMEPPPVGCAAEAGRESLRGEARETRAGRGPARRAASGPAGLELPHDQAAEPGAWVAREAIALAELAVVDDVDAGLDLLLDHLFDCARAGDS